MTRETSDVFTNYLQLLARKIMVHQISFRLEAKQWLKYHYAHTLWDPYYTTIACITDQTSSDDESFTILWGHIIRTFSSHSRQTNLKAATYIIDATSNQVTKEVDDNLSENSWQGQNKISKKGEKIGNLEAQKNTYVGC